MIDDNPVSFSHVHRRRTFFAELNELPDSEKYPEIEPIKICDSQEHTKTTRSLIEFNFYSEKIEANHWRNLFRHVFKRGVSPLDFFDLSHILPLRKCKLMIKKYNKTVRFFIKEHEKIKNLEPLLFPFSFNFTETKLEEKKEKLFPRWIFFITKTNILDFIMKEDVKSIELSIFPIFGKVIGMGKIIDEKGTKKILFSNNPSRFLEIDMEKNPAFYLEVIQHPKLKSLHVQSEEPLFESEGTSIGIDNFDVFKHTLIAGMSGTGKSKYISMMSKAIAQKYPEANILVIDPHAEFNEMMKGCGVVDFKKNYIEPLESGEEKNPLTIQLIAQLISHIIDSKNKYAQRVVFYAVHTLSGAGKLNLFNIGLLLTDTAKRMEFITQTDNNEVKRFFSTEFDDIYMHHFNDAVLPILNFIGQYELYMGEEKTKENLSELLEKNRVTVVSFNPNFFSRDIIHFFAAAVIQQMYILAITKKLKKPTILIVDEFPTVETTVVKSILSEARKFNLFLFLSMQSLSQIKKEILNSILTNTYNLITFKLNKEDAKHISDVMDIKVEEYFRKNLLPSELEEEKKNLFCCLSPRECIVRLYGKDGRFIPPIKVRTVEMDGWIR